MALVVERLCVLQESGEALLAKLHLIHRSQAERLCPSSKVAQELLKRFPDHPRTLVLEKVDKNGADAFRQQLPGIVTTIEPLYGVLEDVSIFHEQSLVLLMEMAHSMGLLTVTRTPQLLCGYARLFSLLVRTHLISLSVPRQLIVQTYSFCLHLLGGSPPARLQHVANFVHEHADPLLRLQEEMLPINQRVGELMEQVALPAVVAAGSVKKLRAGGVLEPLAGARQPEHVLQGLALAGVLRDWAALALITCPAELARPRVQELLRAVLLEGTRVTVFRGHVAWVHDLCATYVQPKLKDLMKAAAGAKTSDRKAASKAAKRLVGDCLDEVQGAGGAAVSAHRARRVFLRQQLRRMLLAARDEPGLLGPRLPIVAAAMAMAVSELGWHFLHAGEGYPKGMPGGLPSGAPLVVGATGCVVELIGAVDDAARTISRYADAVADYAAARLRHVAEEVLAPALEVAPAELREVLGSVQRALASASPGADLEGLRATWARVTSVLAALRAPAAFASLESAGGGQGVVEAMNSAVWWSLWTDPRKLPLPWGLAAGGVGAWGRELALGDVSIPRELLFAPQKLASALQLSLRGAPHLASACCALLGPYSTFTTNNLRGWEGEDYSVKAVEMAEGAIAAALGAAQEALESLLDSARRLEVGHSPAAAMLHIQHARGGAPKGTPAPPPIPGSESAPGAHARVEAVDQAEERLAAVCGAMCEAGPVEIVPGEALLPREYLREWLRTFIRQRVHAAVLGAGGKGGGAAVIREPSVAEEEVRRLLWGLQVVQQHVDFDVSSMAGAAMREAAAWPAPEDAAGEPLPQTIANWYVGACVDDEAGAGAVYVPREGAFVSTAPHPAPDLRGFTGGGELEALVRVLGSGVVAAMQARLRAAASSAAGRLSRVISSNEAALEQLASPALPRRAAAAAAPALQGLDEAAWAGGCLGRALALMGIVDEAAGDAARHHGAAGAEEGAVGDGHAAARLLAEVEAALPSDDAARWGLVPALLGAVLALPALADARVHPITGAMGGALEGIVFAVKAIATWGGTVHGDRGGGEGSLETFVRVACALVPEGGAADGKGGGGGGARLFAVDAVLGDEGQGLLPRSLAGKHVPATLVRAVAAAEMGSAL